MVFQTHWRARNASFASLGILECDIPHCCSGDGRSRLDRLRRASPILVGAQRGKNPSLSYRTFIKAGLANSTDPKVQRFKDWVYGGEDFLKSLLAMAGGAVPEINARQVRRTKARSAHQIIGIVAEHYAVDASGYRKFRSPAGGRDLAAYLCRRYRGATLRELSIEFGLSHPDGSANLVRRAKARLKNSAELRKQCEQIERQLGLNTENQV